MKQYFSYFKFLFITIGVLALLTGGIGLVRSLTENHVRKNGEAPEERVFDYADVLTAAEEKKLAEQIAKREKQIGCDIVIVTIDLSVIDHYGYGANTDSNWSRAMRDFADDFYDENDFGYDRVHGDGVLLLDNWYEDEKGSWLSTCGRVLERYSNSMIDSVLDDVYDRVEKSPYKAYSAYIEDIYHDMSRGRININPLIPLGVAVVAAVIFIASHMKTKEGEKTTGASTYVENGSVQFTVMRDELINKHVTSVAYNPSSSSGGGHSGGGGRHTSRGGVSHGGGGRRR